MLQLTQNLKTKKMELLEVPFPALNIGHILVKNLYSVISAGTEGKSVQTARASYITKAREKPKEFKQVLDSVKTKGLMTTYKLVMSKLDMPAPLGYSCAGIVIEVANDVTEFQVGDLVACGGGTASHAEIVSVPKNLCVKIPGNLEIQYAGFATIGAIALQGIRQADLRIGENCVVIGLGLLGQLTVQMLKAGGIDAVGIDIDADKVALGKQSGAELAIERNNPGLEQLVIDFTNGFGVDAVIITAGTKSLDPVELAGNLCRKKGKVVIVGAVPTGFSRANYYKKELDLRMSCSYGPGRYDPKYEDKGNDYPYGYVRWTEKRNMQAFLQMAAKKEIDLKSIVTHVFDFENATTAYDMILNKTESFLGILLKYAEKDTQKKIIHTHVPDSPSSEVSIGCIGTGSFAQNMLLPILSKYENLVGVADAKGNIARHIGDKYKFQYCTGNAEDIIDDDKISTVFIATPHNLHAELVLKAMQKDKHVFVEKPLCMHPDELEVVRNEYTKRKLHLMVGFNRRFAPHVQAIKGMLSNEEKKAIHFRVNAGILPQSHWVHDKDIGGGRIIGEVCHFIDLAMYLAGAEITQVSASVLKDSQNLEDTVAINMGFKNGSVASISYFSNGNKNLPKEYLEVFSMGQVFVIHDFIKLTIYSKKVSERKLKKQNKGHSTGVKNFLESIQKGSSTPIPFSDIYLTTLATFKVLESIRSGKTLTL